ncbi:MAG: AAA family ATPase [Sphingobacteriales bacterium]|nr:MAG: AAA family ATPase [Sphingobacteriales bacterium]
MLQIEHTSEFETAIRLFEDSAGRHVFLTGRAGTGKSTLLQYFRQQTKKKLVVLAPTGIAALNVGGQTIHSFFGFPPHPIHSDHIKKRPNNTLYKSLDTIIIDEVSMVRADILDAIDYFMRINGREKSLPFGGVQMIFIGDLFQLPPVISSEVEQQLFNFLYETPYFFSANVMHSVSIQFVELKKVFRQKDRHFLDLLDAIRTKNITESQLREINSKCVNREVFTSENELSVILTSTNYLAQSINNRELEKIKSEAYTFEADIVGDFEDRIMPNEKKLTLKRDAQVMFLRNDQFGRWVNGTLGTVKYIDNEDIVVEVKGLDGEISYTLEKCTWEVLRYRFDQKENKIITDVVGSFNQFPIKPAWAITIHKSQGKTFNQVVIDIGHGAFAPGQIYVALSRCTSLEGISLKKPIKYNDIIIDDRILNFAEKAKLY